MQTLAEDVSDPSSEKAALTFFSRCVTAWGQPTGGSPTENGQSSRDSLPGFERFIYERLIPGAFRVPSLPNFNIKDPAITVVCFLHANHV